MLSLSSISSISVKIYAPSEISLLQPLLKTSVILPGTAYTSFPCSSAYSAVIRLPDFSFASIIMTISESPAIILFLSGKFDLIGGMSVQNSEITPP